MSKDDFETESQYKQQLIKELIDICEELKWNIALPNGSNDDEEVEGLIIGNAEYVNYILDIVEDFEDGHSGTA